MPDQADRRASPGGEVHLMFRAKNKQGYRNNILHLTCHCLIFCLVFLFLISRDDLVQAANQAADNSPQEIAIVGGTLIDGNGAAPLQNSVILIKGNRIVRVGSKGKVKYPK